MKKKSFLLLATLVAMFASCQNEEVMEQGSENDRPIPIGDTRIIIEGEGMIDVATRSSDGKVDFTGGYATGAGLYDKDAKPTVAAYPDAGYEVNYFYGGPENEPKKYDYAQTSASLFNVKLNGQNHTFHCGFKEKKRELTVNAGTGGSVSPSGTSSYRVEKAISITASPDNGYKFSGWTVTGGDVTIENPDSPTTTATLHSSNSTITAGFTFKEQKITINAVYNKTGYYLEASSPVPVSITSNIGTSWYEETINTSTGEPEHYSEGYGSYDAIIPQGGTKSNVIPEFDSYSNGAFSFSEWFINSTHSWKNTISGNYRFVLGTDNWK